MKKYHAGRQGRGNDQKRHGMADSCNSGNGTPPRRATWQVFGDKRMTTPSYYCEG